MAQIFHRHANLFIKLYLLLALTLVVIAIVAWRFSIARPAALGEAVPQPVPFSHKHHVTDDRIDCRYCHTSVERSAFAGIPPTETCMTCHSQLFTDAEALEPVVRSLTENTPMEWRRVHDLPDFVYFHHGVHVNNGVGCSTCHGQVDLMPLVSRERTLRMQWCIRCHREPEHHLRPPERIFDMDWRPPPDQATRGKELLAFYGINKSQLTDCSICHR